MDIKGENEMHEEEIKNENNNDVETDILETKDEKTERDSNKTNKKDVNTSTEETNNENKLSENIKNDEKKEEKVGDSKEKVAVKVVDKGNEQLEKSEVQKKKKTKYFIISIVIIIFAIFSVAFAILNINNTKIVKGVTINGTDVSNYTKEQLFQRCNDYIMSNQTKNITLKYNENETIITPESEGTTYNLDEIVDKAYSVGRSGNIFVNNFEIIKSYIFKTNLELLGTPDDEKIKNSITSLNESLEGIVKEANYYIEGDTLIISNGTPGIKVEYDAVEEKIKDAINNYKDKAVIINISVNNVQPEPINIEKVHDEIYKEAEDAYISQDPITVHPNVNGIDFAISIDEAKKIIEEDKEEYEIPLKITIANITLSDLGKEAFPNELGTFSTKFSVSNSGRATNINLATNKINGTIVLPGETFSYNQTVGKRTIEAGYKEAGAYSGGKVVQEVGGGICQVSSTLYNAVLYANLEIVERYNHCFESSYVDASRDATVSWGSVDFKFKNTRKYPIKIEASSKNGTETVTIYGLKEDNEYEVIIQSKVLSIISRTTKYVDDSNIESGEEVILQTGHDGCISEAYRILRKDGATVSSTLLSKDTYNALEKIIKRGTKEIKTEETTSEQQSPFSENENTSENMNNT